MAQAKQTTSIDVINKFLAETPNAYLVSLHLNPSKSFVRNGVTSTGPYYGANKSQTKDIDLGGIILSDTAKVFIPNAPKSTGTPTPGWWPDLPSGVSADELPSTIYRVVLAESPTKHIFANELPNRGTMLDTNGIDEMLLNRTWAEAQDSMGDSKF